MADYNVHEHPKENGVAGQAQSGTVVPSLKLGPYTAGPRSVNPLPALGYKGEGLSAQVEQ